MRLGWEVMWGRNEYVEKFKIDDDVTESDEDVKICAVPKDDNKISALTTATPSASSSVPGSSSNSCLFS